MYSEVFRDEVTSFDEIYSVNCVQTDRNFQNDWGFHGAVTNKAFVFLVRQNGMPIRKHYCLGAGYACANGCKSRFFGTL